MLTLDLESVVPAARIARDADVVAASSRDQAAWAPVGKAQALVRAESTDEVRAVVELCARHGVAVVPRGAGTGLSGGANATDGCVVLSVERMDRILEINTEERLAVVQPGVVNDHLRAAVAEQGLWYPPDPASAPWSTIGGNVATNAGGLCCLKYGVTRDYVLGLELVTPTGQVVRLGRRTAKGVAGFDLIGLIVGSEGSLGVVTEVTVRLKPLPQAPVTVAGSFASLADAGEAVRAVRAERLVPSTFELVDGHCLRAVDDWKNMGLSVDAEVLLLARFDDATAEQHADRTVELFEHVGAVFAGRSSDAEEGEQLFAARRLAYPALERLGPVLTEDVCVPVGAVPEMLRRVEAIGEANDVTIANIAHVGDGNLHPLIIGEPGVDGPPPHAFAAFEQIIEAALDLGGTVTGEHGVGLLKRRGLEQELSPEVVALHHAIKDALDPAGIMNPGKILPELGLSSRGQDG